jgi:hypothetical protein
MKKVTLALVFLCGFAAPAAAMFGYASVPILPYRAARGFAADVQSGAIVTVYQPMVDLTQAVDEAGNVQSGATVAKIYLERYCINALANPQTLTEYGGPLDGAFSGFPRTMFSFYCNWSEVSLLVTLPNGKKFGIPRVQVTQMEPHFDTTVQMDSLHWAFNQDFGGTGAPFVGSATLSPWSLTLTTAAANDYINAYITTPAGVSAIDPFGNDTFTETGSTLSSWNRTWVLDANMVYQAGSGTLTNAKTGICLGTTLSAANNMSTSPNQPNYTVYFAPTSGTAGTWSFFAAKGGAAGVTNSISPAPTTPLDQSMHVRIVYVPQAYAAAYIGGTEVGRVASNRLPTTPTSVGSFAVSAFCYAGSGASASVQEVFTNIRLRCYGKL